MHIKTIDEKAGIYEIHLHPIEEQKISERFPGPNTPVRIGNALRSFPNSSEYDEVFLDNGIILTYE